MAALTYGGTNIRTVGGIFFDLVGGYFEPPNRRGVDIIVPVLAGRTAADRVDDNRSILLQGYIQGTSASNWRTQQQTFFALMDGTYKSLVIADAYLGSTGSPTILARFVNAIGDIPTGLAGIATGPAFQRWSIELEAIAPNWS